jgi:hypothetical protein
MNRMRTPAVNEGQQQLHVTGQAVQLGHDEGGTGGLALGDGLGKFWAVFLPPDSTSVKTWSGLTQEALDGLLLGLKAKA